MSLDPHRVIHLYDGDSALVIRSNGNISTAGEQSNAILAAFEAAAAVAAFGESGRRRRRRVISER